MDSRKSITRQDPNCSSGRSNREISRHDQCLLNESGRVLKGVRGPIVRRTFGVAASYCLSDPDSFPLRYAAAENALA